MSDRVETGPVRFGDDWAGVFLRGDYAAPVAMYLRRAADAHERGELPDPTAARYVRVVADALAECDERGSLDGLQQLPDFAMCKALANRMSIVEQLAAEQAATPEPARGATMEQIAEYITKTTTASGMRLALKILRGEA